MLLEAVIQYGVNVVKPGSMIGVFSFNAQRVLQELEPRLGTRILRSKFFDVELQLDSEKSLQTFVINLEDVRWFRW